MKFKKYLLLISVSVFCLISFAFLRFSISSAAVSSSVTNYLSNLETKNDWSIMAISAIGKDVGLDGMEFLKNYNLATANDISKRIISITSMGKDPRYFGSKDLVGELKGKFFSGQIGDPNLLSDDIFALIALMSAGVSKDDSIVLSLIDFIKSNQFNDGSWDFAFGSQSGSVDFTAMGIMSLLSAGVPSSDHSIVNATNYLLESQNIDGGFPMAKEGESNTESTAWALSAINALGDDPMFWAPGSFSPVDYLNARLHNEGYFLFDSSSLSKDARTPVTTSYSAIALSGKYYPISKISAPPYVFVRIEGLSETLCEKNVYAFDALSAFKSAAKACDLDYIIQDTSFGPYLYSVAGESASGMLGWSYLVNYDMPQVGAVDFELDSGDDVLWFYGSWDSLPLMIVDLPELADMDSVITIRVMKKSNKTWTGASNAYIYVGDDILTSDSNGYISLSLNRSGEIYIYSDGDGLIRSKKNVLKVFDERTQDSMELFVNIESQASEESDYKISFSVSGDLNFGSLKPGGSSEREITISNSGSKNIELTASVSGSDFFSENLYLDSSLTRNWKQMVLSFEDKKVLTSVLVPNNYGFSGEKKGILVFWANVKN